MGHFDKLKQKEIMTERDALYFGALLHDIGKFAFRAQKTQKGDNHEKLGEDFIRKHLSPCKALEGYIEQIIVAANRKSEDIKKADIATAKERESQSSTETRRPLVSIFSKSEYIISEYFSICEICSGVKDLYAA